MLGNRIGVKYAMKICKYCGTEYNDSLDKCPNCGGNKVFSARELEEEANQQQKEIENQERAAAAPAKKKNTIIGVIVAVVVVIAAIAGFSIYKANQPLSNGMTKDEAQGVFDSGVAFMDAGQYEDAIDTFLQLPSDSKKYAEAQELLAQSQDSYRADIISRVDSQVANGDYDSAFSLIEKAQTIIPGDAELQNAYDNTYSAYRAAVLAKADEYSQSGQYKMALEYLSGVQTTFADDAQIQDAYDSINLAYKEQVRTTALTDADNYVASADYVSAINTLNSAIDEIGQDEEVAAKLNIISNDYATSVIDAAKAQYIEYNAGSIFAAEDMLEQALGVLPDNGALGSELAFYEDHAPVPLLSLADDPDYGASTSLSEYNFDTFGTVTDTMGQAHEGAMAPVDWYLNYGDAFAHYSWLLDYQYSKLTGILFFDERYSSAPVDVHFSVTTSAGVENKWTVTNTSGVINFDVDLTGAKSVTLRFSKHDTTGDTFAYLADVYAWK